MRLTNQNYEFPSKHPMKKMKDILEVREIRGVQVTENEGSVLFDLLLQSDIRKVVPKAFKLPVQALGVGISTVARIFGVKVLFETKAYVYKESNEK
jgi:hypothetical protein